MADGEGFEPPEALPPQRFSSSPLDLAPPRVLRLTDSVRSGHASTALQREPQRLNLGVCEGRRAALPRLRSPHSGMISTVDPYIELVELVRDPTQGSPSEVRAWIEKFWPNRRASLQELGDDGPELLVAIFTYAGYPDPHLPRPTGDTELWRGEGVMPNGEVPPRRGVAWSVDRPGGRLYAQKYATTGDAVLWRAVAPPSSFLAEFFIPSENVQEWVVIPWELAEVTEDGRLPQFELRFDTGLPPLGSTASLRQPTTLRRESELPAQPPPAVGRPKPPTNGQRLDPVPRAPPRSPGRPHDPPRGGPARSPRPLGRSTH